MSGTLNWAGIQMNTDSYMIVSFDLTKEKYAQFSLPYYHNLSIHFTPTVAVLRDCLCVSEESYPDFDFVIWQMKKFGVHESWTPLVKVECFITGPLVPLYMSENEDVVFLSKYQGVLFLLKQRENELVRYKIFPEKCCCYNVQNYIEV